MAIKNINEIRSPQYSKNDQQFVRDTIDALANSGQRFGIAGEGMVYDTLYLYDIFPSLKINNDINSYSYVVCTTAIKDSTNISVSVKNITTSYNEKTYKVTPNDVFEENLYTYDVITYDNLKYIIYNDNDICLSYNNDEFIYNIKRCDNIGDISNAVANDNYYIDNVIINSNDKLSVDTLKPTDSCSFNGVKQKCINYSYNDTANSVLLNYDGNDIHIAHKGEGLPNNIDDSLKVFYNNSLLNTIISYNNSYINTYSNNIIFNKLLKKIALDSFDGNYPFEINTYLNTDYAFNVIRNSNDKAIIYNVNDINVEFCKSSYIQNTITEHIIKNNSEHEYIVVDWHNHKDSTNADAHDKYAVYDITHAISPNDDKFDYIQVDNSFTLPYINDDNYWVINNFNTGIKATGKDADQPSVIIIQQLNDQEPQIVSYLHAGSLNNQSFILNGKAKVYVPSTADNYVNYIEEINTPLIDIDEVKYKTDLEDYVKSAMIMSIVQVKDNFADGYQKTKLEEIIPGGFITTFWVYDKTGYKDEETKKTIHFKCVSDKSGVALDFNKLSNLNRVINNSLESINLEPDKYFHTQLVFDFIDKQYKQVKSFSNIKHLYNPKTGEYADLYTQDYPIIFNTLSYVRDSQELSHYQGIFPICLSSDKDYYKNNTILNIGFNDKIEISSVTNKINDNTTQLGETHETSLFADGTKTPLGIQMRYDTDDSMKSTGIKFATTTDYIPNGIYKAKEKDSSGVALSYDNINTPILDVGSVLINNNNFINRLGILTFTKDKINDDMGYIYYSYIGSSYTSTNKSNFILGTSTRNVNANRHIVNPTYTNNFIEQQGIDINFKEVNLNTSYLTSHARYNIYDNASVTVLRQENPSVNNIYYANISVPINKNTLANNFNDFSHNTYYIAYINSVTMPPTKYFKPNGAKYIVSYELSLGRAFHNYTNFEYNKDSTSYLSLDLSDLDDYVLDQNVLHQYKVQLININAILEETYDINNHITFNVTDASVNTTIY